MKEVSGERQAKADRRYPREHSERSERTVIHNITKERGKPIQGKKEKVWEARSGREEGKEMELDGLNKVKKKNMIYGTETMN